MTIKTQEQLMLEERDLTFKLPCLDLPFVQCNFFPDAPQIEITLYVDNRNTFESNLNLELQLTDIIEKVIETVHNINRVPLYKYTGGFTRLRSKEFVWKITLKEDVYNRYQFALKNIYQAALAAESEKLFGQLHHQLNMRAHGLQ